MNLTQLRHFYHFIRSGTYAAAGRELGVDKAAVHQQLRRLQQAVGAGCPLWEPAETGYAPTPRGRKLYEFLAPFFEALPEVMDEVRSVCNDEITVATSPMIALEHMPAAIKAFKKLEPDVTVRLRISIDNAEVLDWLHAYQVHLAVWPDPGPLHGLDVKPLADADVVLAVSRQHALGKKKRISLADFDRQPYIRLRFPWGHTIDAEGFFRRHGVRVDPIVETTDNMITRAYVRENIGFTVGYGAAYLHGCEKHIRVLSLADHFEPARIAVLARPNRTLPLATGKLLELIAEGAKQYRAARKEAKWPKLKV